MKFDLIHKLFSSLLKNKKKSIRKVWFRCIVCNGIILQLCMPYWSHLHKWMVFPLYISTQWNCNFVVMGMRKSVQRIPLGIVGNRVFLKILNSGRGQQKIVGPIAIPNYYSSAQYFFFKMSVQSVFFIPVLN